MLEIKNKNLNHKINISNSNKLPVIVKSGSKDVNLHKQEHRFRSFDRGNTRKRFNHSVINDKSKHNDTFVSNKYTHINSTDRIDGKQTIAMRTSSMDPSHSIAKLTLKPNLTVSGTYKIDRVSDPLSPSPRDKEHWPRTQMNNSEVFSSMGISPKSLVEKYENERKNRVLSVNRITSINKPLNMWDVISMHDVNQFKKESLIQEINRKEKQKQLKKFYDKQVQDKKDYQNYEKQKASCEHLDLVSDCKSIDNFEYNKIKNNHKKLIEVSHNNNVHAQTRKFYDKDVSNLNHIDKSKIDAQIALIERNNAQSQNEEKINKLKYAEDVKDQRVKNEKTKDLEKVMKLLQENHTISSNIQHLDKMEKRYKNIFDVINKKDSDIQNTYKKLGLGNNNFAQYERDKDSVIDNFTNKQIVSNESKIHHENHRRRQQRLELLNETQKANTAQIKNSLQKRLNQKHIEVNNDKLTIMKDLAFKHVQEKDEIERCNLKKKYLKQNLDIQNAQNLLNKRHNFLLNDKEFGINKNVISQLNKNNLGSRDDIQEDLINQSYQKSFL